MTLLLTVAPNAGAAESKEENAPPQLWDACPLGSAAGQCKQPRGIATDPVSGHLYVADSFNHRMIEMTAWGEFVKAWGWGVADGASEPQTCTTSCQAGIAGAAPGQLDSPQGVALDSAGNIYVAERLNFRVQKFDPQGNFLLMLGGEVDKGPNHPGNVCTAAYIAEGDTCGAGTTGTANGQFSPNWPFGQSYIAIGPADQVYVGDENRIQVFDTKGEYQSQIALPEEELVGALAVDPKTGYLYFAPVFESLTSGTKKIPVSKIDPANGKVLGTLATDRPKTLATDRDGNVYVFEDMYTTGLDPDPTSHYPQLVEFDVSGKRIAMFASKVTRGNGKGEFDESQGIATGSACFSKGAGLYVSNSESIRPFIRAYGIPDEVGKCPPPPAAPSIEAEYARSVEAQGAVLGADVNPHFWPDTTYRVQFGTAQCIEEGGWEAPCAGEQPSPPGAKLGGGVTSRAVVTAGVFLDGLAPGTAYRYRFIAQSSGGAPTMGGGEEFLTPPVADAANTACSNQAFRTGPSATLSDCRAYELVSPLDKAGGDAQARLLLIPYPARMDQSSVSGEALTFSSYRPFADAQSGPFSSQYLASRQAGSGWQTEAISPPQEGRAFINPLFQVDNAYRAFSADLEQGWLMTDTEPVLGPGGIAGHPNLYRRQNGNGAYGGCTNAEPLIPEDENHPPQLQGISADGQLGVFRYENKLTAGGSSTRMKNYGSTNYQLYACSFAKAGEGAQLRLVSVLPSGKASTLENTVGGPANESFNFDQGRTATLTNAVSADGSKVFWTASESPDVAPPGALYVRLNPAAEPTESGKCSEAEPEAACTLQISAGPARFWTAARDGSVAIFSTNGMLREFEVKTKQTRVITIAEGVVGASEDVSRIYFTSSEALSEGAVKGQPNLYLHEAGGGNTLIATLPGEPAEHGEWPTLDDPEPVWHAARVSPDGSTLAFMSYSPQLAEQVAGYDNTDQASGRPDAEIYRYSSADGLVCISCNPTGARPRGRELQSKFVKSGAHWGAALLQPWLNSLYAPRVLSDDGNRIFFQSFEALASSDANGKADVYQWERSGTGDCDEADSAFVATSGGCLALLSSGQSPADSELVDASPSGEDVFIRTASSLVGWDPGQIDIYDARVNGGFPAPQGTPPSCEGEACQGPASPPNDATPASSTFHGAGNVVNPARKKQRRNKKKHARKKHERAKHERAKREGRQGR